MPARKYIPPKTVTRIAPVAVADPATDRAIGKLTDAVTKEQERRSSQVLDVNLVVGVNVIRHALGRKPRHVSIMPTVVDASFAWSVNTTHLHADRQLLITVIGVAQPSCTVRVE